jgi:aspartyl protease family protein
MSKLVNHYLYYLLIIYLFSILSLYSCARSGRGRIGHEAGQFRAKDNGVAHVDNYQKGNQSGRILSGGKNHINKTISAVKMAKVNGVYQIPVAINGVPMYFIFDTGAGMISISMLEATFLYKQGKLSSEDFIGKSNFTDANGNISEGEIIMLHSVKVGTYELHDVKASVVNNLKAPLLIGQTALDKFGKITIDYQNEQILFQ